MRTVRALVRACHPAPTAAVTVLAALLAVGAGHAPWRVALIASAVFAGQLTIGWSNDLIDRERDRAVGRADKPVATGDLTVVTLGTALAVAAVACVALSLATGVVGGLAHLAIVAVGWSYNLGLKRTVWSWLPYAVAFGGLPVFVWLAGVPPALPAWWVPVVGALLGVGAHLLNALPDLADDAATGVRGLPQRLGARGASALAVVVLIAGTAGVVIGPAGPTPWWAWAVLAASVVVSIVSLAIGRKAPFRAAMVIAVVDVVLLVARS